MSIRFATAAGTFEFDTTEEAVAFQRAMTTPAPVPTPAVPPHPTPTPPPRTEVRDVSAAGQVSRVGPWQPGEVQAVLSVLSPNQRRVIDLLRQHIDGVFADDAAGHLGMNESQIGPIVRHLASAIQRAGIDRSSVFLSEKRKKPGQTRPQGFLRLAPAFAQKFAEM